MNKNKSIGKVFKSSAREFMAWFNAFPGKVRGDMKWAYARGMWMWSSAAKKWMSKAWKLFNK